MAGTNNNKKTFTLLELFDGLICDEFRFRKQGISANYYISLPHILYVPYGAAIMRFDPGSGGIGITPTTPKIAVHLNFKCTVSMRGNSLNLAIAMFHLTARPARDQHTIDEAGPSQLTAKESVHINRNTGWGREENLTELLRVLNTPSREELLHVLNYHFSERKVRALVSEWKERIKIKAQHNTKIMNITWDDSDKTFDF